MTTIDLTFGNRVRSIRSELKISQEKLESLKSSPGRKRANELENLETELRNKIKVNKNTEDFHNQIDILSSSFYEKLKNVFSNLTKNDIRLCSLVRLNMDTKQITILQNILAHPGNFLNFSTYQIIEQLPKN